MRQLAKLLDGREERLQPVGVASDCRREHFDRDGAAERCIAGAVHLSQSTRTQRSENLVMPDRVRHVLLLRRTRRPQVDATGQASLIVRDQIDDDLRDIFRSAASIVSGSRAHKFIFTSGLDELTDTVVLTFRITPREDINRRLGRARRRSPGKWIAAARLLSCDVTPSAAAQMRNRRPCAVEDPVTSCR